MGYVIHIQPGFAGDALTGVQKLLQLRPVAAALDMHLKYHSSSYLSMHICIYITYIYIYNITLHYNIRSLCIYIYKQYTNRRTSHLITKRKHDLCNQIWQIRFGSGFPPSNGRPFVSVESSRAQCAIFIPCALLHKILGLPRSSKSKLEYTPPKVGAEGTGQKHQNRSAVNALTSFLRSPCGCGSKIGQWTYKGSKGHL